MSEPGQEHLLSVGEVAKYLGVSPWWVYQAVGRGLLPAMKFGRRVVRIRLHDLEAFESASQLPVQGEASAR